jgi:hypothetical protein
MTMVVGAAFGWIFRVIWSEIKSTQKDQRTFEYKISTDFVRKDDYRIDVAEIKGMLTRIFDRLEDQRPKS